MSQGNDAALSDRLRAALKAISPPILVDAARAVKRQFEPPPKRRVPHEMLRDIEFYRPHFSPWEGLGEFKSVMAKVAPYSDVSADRVWVLYTLAQQARHLPGDFWECGVFRGGTATALAGVLAATHGKKLHLFDTFSGLPAGKPDRDFHQEGLYSNTSLEGVKDVVGREEYIQYHVGLIPDTFKTMESERVAFAHIDTAIYQSILDCCAFIYPRLSGGGFMVFDDYGFRSCPGARLAVDEYFADKLERPLVLPTRQAVVTKLPERSS